MTTNEIDIIKEYEKCAANFSYFCENYLRLFRFNSGMANFKLLEHQESVVYPAYEKHRFNIVRKFRQAGLSTMTAGYVLWKAIFLNDQSIAIASRTNREAMKFMRIVREFYRGLPDWLRPPTIKDNNHWLEFKSNKSKIISFSASSRITTTYNLLIIEEAAFINKMDECWASMFPTISTDGHCIIISTPNDLSEHGRWYREQYAAAIAGQNGFNPVCVSFRQDTLCNFE